MTKKSFYWLWISIITASCALIGVFGYYLLSSQSKADMAGRLERDLEISLAAFEPERIARISETLSDTGEDFDLLRTQFLRLEEIFRSDGIDSVYSMKKSDDRILFLVDSTPLDSEVYGPPGGPYLNPPAELFSVFSDGEPAFVGPYVDEYGEFYSYFKPIRRHSDGSIVGVLGLDVQTGYYIQQFKRQLAYFFGILAVFYLLALFLPIYIKKFRHSREESQTQKKMTEDLIDVLPDIFYLVDRDGKFILWNRSLLEISGWHDKDMLGTSLLDLFAEEDKKRVEEGMARVYRKGSDSIEAEVEDKEGKKRLFEFSIAILKDGRGGTIGLAGSGHDISLRHQREKALAEQRDTLTKVNRLMVGREMKMIDMKKEIDDLRRMAGGDK